MMRRGTSRDLRTIEERHTGDYFSDGALRAHALPNRGPLEFTEGGQPHPDILEAYWRYGF